VQHASGGLIQHGSFQAGFRFQRVACAARASTASYDN